ncbi:hypothetical protein [Nocardioides dongxiaopingii]|nr:hypothetical protein [Nocardioides sp. S-1144]
MGLERRQDVTDHPYLTGAVRDQLVGHFKRPTLTEHQELVVR